MGYVASGLVVVLVALVDFLYSTAEDHASPLPWLVTGGAGVALVVLGMVVHVVRVDREDRRTRT